MLRSSRSVDGVKDTSEGERGREGAPSFAGERRVCPRCNSAEIIVDVDTGELVCSECGLVIAKGLLLEGKEWRAFSVEESMERARSGAPVTPTKPAYGLDTQISYSKGANGRTTWILKRAKRYAKTKIERKVMPALFKLRAAAQRLNLPAHTVEDAAKLFRMASSEDMVKGRSMDTVVAAAIYASCRRTEVPRYLEEVASFFKLTEKQVGRALRYLFKELGIRIPPVKPEIYVPRVCSELKLPQSVATMAMRILMAAREVGVIWGKEPLGVAAAAIYLACQEQGIQRTQRELARAALVTEVTVRNRYRSFLEKVWPLLEKEEELATVSARASS